MNLLIHGSGEMNDNNNDNVTVILQARMSSTRLPGKVLSLINDKPMIYWQVKRIQQAKKINRIIVATSTDKSDDEIETFALENRLDFFRGSLTDVYSRYLECIVAYDLQGTLIRLTGDCPLVMPELIDNMYNEFSKNDCDYLSNTLNPTYPDGLDIEICKITSFINLSNLELDSIEREHATYAFHTRRNLFNCVNFEDNVDESRRRWTVDYQGDLDFMRNVFAHFKGREGEFSYSEVLSLIHKSPTLKQLSGVIRNEALLSQIGDSNE